VRIHAATSSAARSRLRRGAALAVPLIAVGSALAIYGGTAGAAPQPTISQVQTQVNSLQAKVDRIGQQYDAASEQLTAARSRLAQVNREATLAQQRFETARRQLTQVAVAAYMDSNQSSVLGLLTSGNPSDVLNQASLVTQVAGMHQAQAAQFLGDAQQLTSVVQQRQRTESGIAAVQKQLAAQKNSMAKLLASKKSTLDSLTAAQQAQVAANTIGGGGGTTSSGSSGTTQATYTGSTSSQAGQAVAFAYAQLGKPYQWGATGPGSYDCSGLVQAAWASAGVSIPRTTYDMWASLPHISSSSIQPGDLLFYAGESHVSIYVGGGYIIDAPQTGENVQKISESGWYASNFDGAVRP
jgi:peptidoglycan DL-endopeptidase CwlO